MAEFNREGLGNILFVAIALCLVCSILVSSAAVILKPQRLLNQELAVEVAVAGFRPDPNLKSDAAPIRLVLDVLVVEARLVGYQRGIVPQADQQDAARVQSPLHAG